MKTEPAKSMDRRVQRTHRLLCDALADLILEQGWDNVTVQDICRRADVGRATFYMHYASKEKLLIDCFKDLRAGFRAQCAALGGGNAKPFAFVQALVEYAGQNKRLFRSVIGRRSGHLVQNRFRQMVVDLVEEDLAALAPGKWPLAATARYIAGGFAELLTWWLETRNSYSPVELERLFHQFAGPIVSGARQFEPASDHAHVGRTPAVQPDSAPQSRAALPRTST